MGDYAKRLIAAIDIAFSTDFEASLRMERVDNFPRRTHFPDCRFVRTKIALKKQR
jgi:hypothetical protein